MALSFREKPLDWFFFFCVFWLLLLDIKLPYTNAGGSVVLAVLLLFIINPHLVRRLSFDRYFVPLLTLLFIYALYVTLRSIWSQDLSYLFATIKILLIIFFSYVVTRHVLIKYGETFYVSILLSIFLIVSLSPALYYFFEWYKGIVELFQVSLQLEVPIHERGALGMRRSFPTASGGFFGMAVLLGFYSYILVYFYQKRLIGFKLFALLFVLSVMSAIIAGRVAIIFLLASFCVFFIGSRLADKLFMLLGVVFFFLFASAFFVALDGRQVVLELSENYSFFKWMFEPVVNYIEYGVLESRSTSHLMEMWYIPGDLTILVGDGLYSDYYGGTDIGYMRQILFGGVSVVLFSLLYAVLVVRILPLYYGIFFLSLLLAVHAKGNVILGAPMTMALISSFYAFVCFSSSRPASDE